MRQDTVDESVSGVGWNGLGKVTPPALNRIHENERLFGRLDAAFARSVVWVQGQPGAGKTTLVASYLAARKIEPLWYRLDEGDADPATLFYYLGEAARRTRRPGAPELQRLTPEFRPATANFARRFFRDLFEGGASTLVFDDYHEVATSAALHDFLPQALEETPAGRHVIVVSRGAPPAQLARLRLNGMVEVVGGDAFRLSVEEAMGLAGERDARADPTAIELLVERTQGWAAGLVLMLEAAESGDGPTLSGGEASSEVLFDYFAGEVFGRMTPRGRRILAAVALMPDATAAQAILLTGASDAASVLEDLRRRNYFTTRDVQAEPRYRFHPLFRDFLLAGASGLLSGSDLSALKARAAAILEAEEQPEPAAALLGEARAFDELAALIKRWGARLIEGGRNDTLTSWLGLLPDDVIAADGWLSYWLGTARLYFRYDDVLPRFERAFELMSEKDDVPGLFMAWANMAECVRTDAIGSMARFDALIVRMRELRARHPDFPSPEIELRVCWSMAVALARRSGDRAEIAFWTERALALARAAGRHAETLVGYIVAINDFHDANNVAARNALESLPDPLTLDRYAIPLATGVMAHVIALAYRQRSGDLADFTEQALYRLELAGYLPWMAMMASIATTDRRRKNDVAGSAAWVRRSAEFSERVGAPPGAHYYFAASQHCLLVGDVAGAKQHADKAVEVAKQTGWRLYEALGENARAEALLETSAFDAAGVRLDVLEDLVERSATRVAAFPAALMRADLAFSLGHENDGVALLRRAMAIGRRQDDRRAPLLQARVSRLCAKALQNDVERDFVLGFIRYAEVPPPDPDDERWPWPLAIRTLGTFEIVQDGRSLAVSRKTPKRLIALLKAIVAFGGTDAPESQVVDAVWPDEDGDAGRQSFKVAIHRLRQLLGDTSAVIVRGARVTLDPACCWLDVRAFDRLGGPKALDESEDEADARQARALALYRGDFLAGDDDLYWAEPRRDQARGRFIRTACEAAERRARAGDCDGACAIYRRAMEAAPSSEEICQALMRRCFAAGHGAEGRAAYEGLAKILADSFGSTPAPTTEALYRKLLTI